MPHQPEDWPGLFTQHLNASDLDAVMVLYEPGARFVAPSGDIVTGREQIRPVLAGMIRSQTRLQSRVIKAVTVVDVALAPTFMARPSMRPGKSSPPTTKRSRSCDANLTALGSSSWVIPAAVNEAGRANNH